MNKYILWIAAGAATLFLLTRVSLSKRLNFVFQGLRTGGTVLQPQIEISVLAQNPTNNRATLRSLSGQLFLNDKFIANISSFQPQTIEPNSETAIRINARPSVVGIFSTIKNVLTNKTGTNVVSITGAANVDNVSLPFEISQTI